MSIDFIDRTGEPVSDEDIQESINCMKTVMIKHATTLPIVTLQAATIIHALEELKAYRKLIREHNRDRE